MKQVISEDIKAEASKYYIHEVSSIGSDYGGSQNYETITENDLEIKEEMMLIKNSTFIGVVIDEGYKEYNGYHLTNDTESKRLLVKDIGTKKATCEVGEYYGDDDHSRWNLTKYTLLRK